MSDLDPAHVRALREALPSSAKQPPVAAITARGATLLRRRRAAVATVSLGSLAVGVAGLVAVSGSGRPATLGVTAPVASAATAAPTASTASAAPDKPGAGPQAFIPLSRPSNSPCPPSTTATTPPEDLISAHDRGTTSAALNFNRHALDETQVLQAVAARVHDHDFGVAQADGTHDDLIVWRTGGAAGASPAYASAAAKVGIPVVFRAAVLSAGQIEKTSHALFGAAGEFRAAGVTLDSAFDDGHDAVTVGVDPLTDDARRIAAEHAPYGAASIVVVCDQGVEALGALTAPAGAPATG